MLPDELPEQAIVGQPNLLREEVRRLGLDCITRSITFCLTLSLSEMSGMWSTARAQICTAFLRQSKDKPTEDCIPFDAREHLPHKNRICCNSPCVRRMDRNHVPAGHYTIQHTCSAR